MAPVNWPKDFIYTPVSIPTNLLPALLDFCLSTGSLEDGKRICPWIESQRVHPALRIKKLIQPHPLAGQRGLFATRKIEAGTELGEFTGEIGYGLSLDRRREGFYDWGTYINGKCFMIDAGKMGNELSFVNDYRGLSDTPNVRTKWIIHRGRYYFGYETTREIPPRAELLIDYGPAWEKFLHGLQN